MCPDIRREYHTTEPNETFLKRLEIKSVENHSRPIHIQPGLQLSSICITFLLVSLTLSNTEFITTPSLLDAKSFERKLSWLQVAILQYKLQRKYNSGPSGENNSSLGTLTRLN